MLTLPEALALEPAFAFLATVTVFTGSTYNFETTSSVEVKVFKSISYFSEIEILSIFVLPFSFKSFTTFSASSKEET